MKIVTWNCNGAFRKKFEMLSAFEVDVYVIQECENPVESKDVKYIAWASNYLWVGTTKNKGLGVFAKHDISLRDLQWSDEFRGSKVKYFLPCKINDDFTLLAVWTHRNNSPNFGYIGQLWKYLQVNKSKLQKSFVIGDFNSNAIWDEWDRWWNHSDVVKELQKINIHSVYHHVFKEEHGKESVSTLFFQKNLEKPYHIDYVFSSVDFLEKTRKIEIGQPNKWLTLSDHMPIFYEFD